MHPAPSSVLAPGLVPGLVPGAEPPLHPAILLALALLSALAVRGMIALHILDRPDARKAHAAPTPKGGGVGVVAAFLAGIALVQFQAGTDSLAWPYFRGVVLAAIAIAAVSMLDDLRDMPFAVKLAAQLVAAGNAVAAGLWVREYRLPLLGGVDLGGFGAVVTIGWIVLATNAVNFMDGLNGLAAGSALIACLFLAPVAALHGGGFVCLAALLLAAGLAGFLPFNFPRARIFLGDVGSQFCGFMLAVLGVAASRFERMETSFLIVPMLLSAILYDVLFTLVRRTLAGERITRPHRGHLFQLAHRAGMRATRITLLHWGFACWAGLVSLGFVAAGPTGKLVLPLLLLPPQFAWTAYAMRLARRAGIWGAGVQA